LWKSGPKEEGKEEGSPLLEVLFAKKYESRYESYVAYETVLLSPQFGVKKMSAKKTVGKYDIGRTLGEGTFGKVKFAVNTETGEEVAIKV